MSKTILFWRRIDVHGLERLEVNATPEGITADATLICADDGGFRLDHRWVLSPDWRALMVEVERRNADRHDQLKLERCGNSWRVNGEWRGDLENAEEPDLSVTPFCNTLPIRRTPEAEGSTLTLDTAYIDGPAMTVQRSRQQYVRRSSRRLTYLDLGTAHGFTAELLVDEEGLIVRYEHLFERVVL